MWLAMITKDGQQMMSTGKQARIASWKSRKMDVTYSTHSFCSRALPVTVIPVQDVFCVFCRQIISLQVEKRNCSKQPAFRWKMVGKKQWVFPTQDAGAEEWVDPNLNSRPPASTSQWVWVFTNKNSAEKTCGCSFVANCHWSCNKSCQKKPQGVSSMSRPSQMMTAAFWAWAAAVWLGRVKSTWLVGIKLVFTPQILVGAFKQMIGFKPTTRIYISWR